MSSHPNWLDRSLAVAASVHARRQLRRFRRSLHDARRVQERVLLRLIRRHQTSDFGRDHGFGRIRSVKDFVAAVPIRDYDALAPYLGRVRAGEPRALFATGERIRMFAMTSGSTADPKYIPITDEFVRQYRRGWNIFGVKALRDHPAAMLRPILQVSSPMDVDCTPAGVPCGSISGLLAATQKRVVQRYYAVPPAVARIRETPVRYYTIMRLAIPQDVGFMVTASPATQLQLARAAEDHAERIIRDIHDGTLTSPGDLEPGLRNTLAARLAPDPVTSRRLANIVAREGAFRPRHYWNLAFLANWTGGTLAMHLGDFPAYFGDTPVRDIGLLATEGRVTIGVEDGVNGGVLDVEGGFFEFLPCGSGEGEYEAVPCHEVVVGETYRVIMTNAAGLYRYDIGDHVRVIDFIGQASVLEFLHRGSRTASVTGEKITEWQVTRAFQQATAAAGTVAATFILAPRWADPPYYRLYLQHTEGRAGRYDEMVVLTGAMDRFLCDLNAEYQSKRRSGRLGPIEMCLVQPGFLDQRDEARRRGYRAAGEQFKHQFLLTQPGQDEGFPVAAVPGEPALSGMATMHQSS